MPRFQPPSGRDVPRFTGVHSFMKLPVTQELQDVDVAIAGVPLDATASYRTGCRFGPQSIRDLSMMCRRYNPYQKINVFDYVSAIDYGDLPVATGYVKESFERIEMALIPIVQAGIIPILMGGDHSVTLPELRAIAQVHGPVSMIHFDSHVDTWDEYYGTKYTHGTPFRRAAEEGVVDAKRSIQIGMRGSAYDDKDYEGSRELGFEVIPALEVRDIGFDEVIRRAKERVGGNKTFLTFDIDFLDPAVCPGTGTPEIGGFNTVETLQLVRGLDGPDYVGFDVVEVLPAYDVGEVTALTAANLMFEFMSLVALMKRRQA